MQLKKYLPVGIASLLIISILGYFYGTSFLYQEEINTSLPPKFESLDKQNEEAEEEGIKQAQQWLEAIRFGDEEVDPKYLYQARAQVKKRVQQQARSKKGSVNWNSLGPDNQGGRTRAILVDRNNSNRVYAGGVAGGLWVSDNKGNSWERYSGFTGFMTVSEMDQAPNGDIYVATGEGFAARSNQESGSGGHNSGHIGNGIYKKKNGESQFKHLSSTTADTGNLGHRWSLVYDVEVSPKNSNHVYAATDRGLMVSLDGGNAWTAEPQGTNDTTQRCDDVTISSDGTVYAAIGGNFYKSQTGSPGTFTNVTNNLPDPANYPAGAGRMEFATTADDPNYVYLVTINNSQELHNVYRSTDKGDSWTIIGPGGTGDFNPHGTQGVYDNAFNAAPNDKDKIFLGGQLFFYRWTKEGGWYRVATGFSPRPYRMHVDYHAIAFDPNNPNIMYVGNDGGLYRSTDQGDSYKEINKGYVTTQFYGLGVGANGDVAGGTQDNGSHYMDYTSGNTERSSTPIFGGDGGYCQISHINPDFVVAHVGAPIARMLWSLNRGGSFQSAPLDENIDNTNNETGNPGGDGVVDDINAFLDFVTPYYMWENPDKEVKDSIFVSSFSLNAPPQVKGWYRITDTIINAGDTVYPYEISRALTLTGDSIFKRNNFFVGSNNIWMTKEALTPSSPIWFQLGSPGGNVRAFGASADGDTVFAGTSSGVVMRVSGVNSADYGYIYNCNYSFDNNDSTHSYDCDFDPSAAGISTDPIIVSSGRFITGIGVDQNNANNVAVTMGRYGNTDFVYYSTNALSGSPSFTNITGNLPKMPAYDVVIDQKHPNWIYVATEFGVWRTTNPNGANTNWVPVNGGDMDPVATFHIEQIPHPLYSDSFALFTSTHARGFFAYGFDPCDDVPGQNCVSEYTGINNEGGDQLVNSLLVYPNPMRERGQVQVDLSGRTDVQVQVYNLKGELVKDNTYKDQLSGKHRYQLETSNLESGIYLVHTLVGGEQFTNKVVVAH